MLYELIHFALTALINVNTPAGKNGEKIQRREEGKKRVVD